MYREPGAADRLRKWLANVLNKNPLLRESVLGDQKYLTLHEDGSVSALPYPDSTAVGG